MTTEPAGAADQVTAEVLHGPEHPTLGDRAVRPVGEHAAIALSAGRYPKAVPALDDNEDAVVGLAGPAVTLVAVADGHVSADAALAAVDAIARDGRALVSQRPRDLRRAVADLGEVAGEAVEDVRYEAAGERRNTATALSVALVAGRTAWTVTFGDTAVVRIRGQRAKLISRVAPFLTSPGVPATPRRERLRAGDHVVAVCDGVSDHLGRRWPVEVARRIAASPSPAEVADAVLAGAMDGAAGDHLSCGVVRLP
jgi:serine/threonine protein phosphatase PrpC